MCTAAAYRTKDFYFGRNLDYERNYGESVTVTPRKYALTFRNGETWPEHYAIIGMAHVQDGYPLYYDAVNEKGLAIAGLNFVGSAVYHAPVQGRDNVAQFEADSVAAGPLGHGGESAEGAGKDQLHR